MKTLLIISLILLTGFCSSANAADIKGMVTDSETGDPLPGVHVSVKDTRTGTASDVDGIYEIKDIPLGKYRLEFRVLGYDKKRIELNITEDSIVNFDIALTPSPWELDEVVVTATRRKQLLKDVPVTTELITKTDMAATGALTVAAALESHIGVMIDDDLSGRGVTLRGVDPSRVLVLIDGHRIVGRVQGSIDLGQIPISDVQQIEIVKGTGSTLYGSDALGGVINIITKNPEEKLSLRGSVGYGSYNTIDPEFEFQARKNKFGVLLSGKYVQTDGFDLLEETPHTNGLEEVKRSNWNAKLTFDPHAGYHHDLSLGYMHEQKIWIESENFPGIGHVPFDDYEWNDRYNLRYSAKYVFNKKTEVEASLYGSIYDHEWEKYTQSGVKDDSSETKDNIIEGSLQLIHVLRDYLIFTTGGDYSNSELESSEIVGGERSISFSDIYLQAEWMPRENITVMPGVRWEEHETYGTNINPSMNLKWSPYDMLTFRGTASRGFRAPSIKELYFEFDHSAAGYIVFGGGDSLDAETSENFSLTTELNYNRRGLHRFTIFRNDLNNLIEFDLIDYADGYWRGRYQYLNIVEARTQGFEWESEIKICTGWDFSFSYTYIDAQNMTDNTKLINRPPHTIKFRTIMEIPYIETNMTLWGMYHDHKLWTAKADTPDRISDVYAPKRIVLNLNLNKNIYKNLDAYFRVENLTDKTEYKYGYWPERAFTGGIKFKFF